MFANFIFFLGAIVNGAEAAYLRESRNMGDNAASPPPDGTNETLPDITTIDKWLSGGNATDLTPPADANQTTPAPSASNPNRRPYDPYGDGGIVGGYSDPKALPVVLGVVAAVPVAMLAATAVKGALDTAKHKTYFNKLVESILDGSFTGHEINLSSVNLGPNKINDDDLARLMSALKKDESSNIRAKIIYINLSSNHLKSTPDVSIFPNLISLKLSNNILNCGPDISNCTKLKELYIDHNYLTAASQAALIKLQEQNVGLSIFRDSYYPALPLSRQMLIKHFQKDAREYFSSEEFMQTVLWCNKFATNMHLAKTHFPEDIIVKIVTEYMINLRKGYENRMISQTRFFTSAFVQGSPEHAILQDYIAKDLEKTLAHVSRHIEKIMRNIFKADGVAAKAMQRLMPTYTAEIGFSTTEGGTPLPKPPPRPN